MHLRALIRRANDVTGAAWDARDADRLVVRDTHSVDLGARLRRLGAA